MQEPSLGWREVVTEGEAAHFEELGIKLRDVQRTRATHGNPLRALHAKGQAQGLVELAVLPNIPPYARIGLFATPRTWKGYVRFSNGAGFHQPDTKADVRGVAIKLLDVPGEKIIPGLEAATTQDFLLIQSPATPFRDPDEFVWFVLAAAQPLLLLPRALGRFGPVRALGLVKGLAKSARPVVSLATSPYYSALPITFGPLAAKYALVPRAQAAPGAKAGASREYLTAELAARLALGPVEYDFAVQFYEDERTTPIEDASVVWPTPFVTLARLTIPRQDLSTPEARALAGRIEGMSFDPWHATADFRPLGAMMRARSVAYRLSTHERHATPEPTGAGAA